MFVRTRKSSEDDLKKINDEFKRVVEDNTKVMKQFYDFLKSLETAPASYDNK